MSELALIETRKVNNTLVDGWYNEQAFFTREQIWSALEYPEPRKAIDLLHRRHKERLDHFSVTVKLTATDGKAYSTIVYNRRGVFEICRWSRQPKADMVMDALYDMAESVEKKGYFSTVTDQELYEQLGNRLNRQQELVLREYIPAEPRSSVASAIPLSWIDEKIVTDRTK